MPCHLHLQFQPPLLSLSSPDKFVGDPSQCQGFLLQCELYFTTQVGLSGQAKIIKLLNLLTYKVLQWATAVWEQGSELLSSYEYFVTLFC